jgi:uncharacterized protein YutE (UPF0331/DUF86 family)
MNADHLIAKRLAFITDCVAEIRQLGRLDRLLDDKVQQRFVEHTLQIAIQAMLDVAFAIVSEQKLGEPTDNRQAFERLTNAGYISAELGALCRRMVAFRNVVVHRYLQVDPRCNRSPSETWTTSLGSSVRSASGWVDSGSIRRSRHGRA